MITLEEIKHRIGKNEGCETTGDYVGLNFDADEKECDNYKFLSSYFPEYFEFDWCLEGRLRLHSHEGSIWLADVHDDDREVKEFSGWNTEDIILYLIKNKVFNKEDIISRYPCNIARIISPTDRYRVLKRQSWRCNQCGTKLKYSKNHDYGDEVAHIDHIHPFSKKETYPKGPSSINELSNLQALCPTCNKKKRDMLCQ